MKRLLKILLGLIIILGIVFLIIRTTDVDITEMRTKYSGELAQFTGTPPKAQASELNIHYRDQGNPDGQPIFFIHGSNASLHT